MSVRRPQWIAFDLNGTLLDLAALFDDRAVVVDADEACAYKPDARVYAHAARRLDVAPDRICLVAAHAWDVMGAMRAGWLGGWVAHRERHLLATVSSRPCARQPWGRWRRRWRV